MPQSILCRVKRGRTFHPYSKFDIHKLSYNSCIASNLWLIFAKKKLCNVTRSPWETRRMKEKNVKMIEPERGCKWAEARLNALNEIIKQVENWCKGEAAKSMRTYADRCLLLPLIEVLCICCEYLKLAANILCFCI